MIVTEKELPKIYDYINKLEMEIREFENKTVDALNKLVELIELVTDRLKELKNHE